MDRPYKIWVFEDLVMIRDDIARELENRGYDVRCGASPYFYQGVFFKNPPDLVITDQNMPSICGVEFAKQLRADPRAQKIKIVGYGDFPDDAKGFDAILRKRLNIPELCDKVKELLEGSE